jgi:DNA-directed RNA polymerase specialized sigma24 family protein
MLGISKSKAEQTLPVLFLFLAVSTPMAFQRRLIRPVHIKPCLRIGISLLARYILTINTRLPWAFGFARQRVMAYRKTCSRSRLVFGENTLDLLSDQCLKVSDTIDDRLTALQICLKRLSTAQAELIHERYTAKTPVQAIAARMNDSADNISVRLHRIRKILGNCVERTLATEAR